MLDLDFHAALPYGAVYTEVKTKGLWMWMPAYFFSTYSESLEHTNQLISDGWTSIGVLGDLIDRQAAALASQLGQMRLIGAKDSPEHFAQSKVWIPRTDYDHIAQMPVLLSFTLVPDEAQKVRSLQSRGETISRTLPPANLGEVALILGMQGDKKGWIRCPITKLAAESQALHQRLGAALSTLDKARLERTAWLEQWKEIQAMARKLAADYWRAYQDSQIERPQPIDIWKLGKQEGAIAAMTMVQDGAHASINNKDKWEREHMIQDARYQGLVVNRFIHKTASTVNEYWIEPPKEMDAPVDPNAPVDPDLVSQEVLEQQAKLDDLEADLVTLAPVYLLAKGEDEVYISPEQLLKDLGFTPVHNQAGYGNTYHQDEMQRVIDAFERLAWLKIKTHQSIQKSKGRKPALIIDEAPYLAVMGRRWQVPLDGFGPRRFLGWKYRIPWLKNFTGDTEAGKQLGVLLKKSFQFSQKQRWEKRLARYLTIHLCVAAHKRRARINCINRRVLEQCGLMPTERDKARPAEYVAKFKRAMDNLRDAQIIGDWRSTLDESTLPPRAWLDLWLDSSFWVTQSPTALEVGYQKMIDTREPRKTEKKGNGQ